MKQFLIFLLCFLLTLTVVSCSTETKHTSINYPESGQSRYMEIPEGLYAKMVADWPIYHIDDLVQTADIVLIGRVKSIEFRVLDMRTALPPTESTPAYAKDLYTIYHLDVLNIYKGDVEKSVSIRISGGMVGYRENEQLDLLQDYGMSDIIPVWDAQYMVQCAIGESYLFVLKQFETGLPTMINLTQTVYVLDEPTRMNTVDDSEKVWYSGDDGARGYSMSAVDVISFFGDKHLKEFEQNWVNGLYKKVD